MIRTLKSLQLDFTSAEKELMRAAVNTFGEKNHPYADDFNLPHFSASYVAKCLKACVSFTNDYHLAIVESAHRKITAALSLRSTTQPRSRADPPNLNLHNSIISTAAHTTNHHKESHTMKNIRTSIEGNDLVIRVNANEVLGPSASGKTNMVANSGGFQPVEGSPVPGLKLSLNVIRPLTK